MTKTNAVPKTREEKGETPQTSTQIHTLVIFTKPQVKANIQSQPKKKLIEEQPIPTPTVADPRQPKKEITSFRTLRVTTQEAFNAFTMGVKDDQQTRHAKFTRQKFNIPQNTKDALDIEQFCAPVIHLTTGGKSTNPISSSTIHN